MLLSNLFSFSLVQKVLDVESSDIIVHDNRNSIERPSFFLVKSGHTLVLSIRGTSSLADMVTDMNAYPTKLPVIQCSPECSGHGMNRLWKGHDSMCNSAKNIFLALHCDDPSIPSGYLPRVLEDSTITEVRCGEVVMLVVVMFASFGQIVNMNSNCTGGGCGAQPRSRCGGHHHLPPAGPLPSAEPQDHLPLLLSSGGTPQQGAG